MLVVQCDNGLCRNISSVYSCLGEDGAEGRAESGEEGEEEGRENVDCRERKACFTKISLAATTTATF